MNESKIFGKFSEFFHCTTNLLTLWLKDVLNTVDHETWWQTLVVPKLSYQQAQRIKHDNITQLGRLDLAALLRIMDKNWYEISQQKRLTTRDRHYVKEMQIIRNRWAHSDTYGLDKDDVYRDIDNLQQFLTLIGADDETISEIKQLKNDVLIQTAAPKRRDDDKRQVRTEDKSDKNSDEFPDDNKGGIVVGSIIELISDPSMQGAVVELDGNSPDARCKVFIDGNLQQFYLSQLSVVVTKGEKRVVPLSELHSLLTCLQIRHPSLSTLYSLNAARIDFVPYQFRPALKIIRSDQPRLLIADGVGVGKTIEAGLVLRELQARNDIESVLIICPKPLVAERKWELEMKRFDERFTQLDGNGLRHCIEETDLDGEWPDQHKKTIIPFSLFDENLLHGYSTKRKNQLGLFQLDPPPRFDLVIVDEAHHIRNSTTFAHQGVRFLCENAEAVLFLTATPVQMGSHDLYTLLRLLRPDLVIDEEAFEHMAEPNPYINQALSAARSGGDDWGQLALESLELAAGTPWGNSMLRHNPVFKETQKKLAQGGVDRENRVLAIRDIENFHSFSRIINRTRRRDIGNFCLRRPYTIEVPFTEEQKELHDQLLRFEATALSLLHGSQNVNFMMSTIRRQAASCIFGLAPFIDHILNRRLTELEWQETTDEELAEVNNSQPLNDFAQTIFDKATSLPPDDPKFDEFLIIILEKQDQENNKVMVFSSFRHTLSYLEKKLLAQSVRVGLVHGDIKDEERLLLRRRFERSRDAADAIDVMLFSEVGCEGLDYQFCDLMINYDLPWNPMRIEQRIGRIDRRGQKSEAVAIYNLITPDTVDADIYNRCLLRIGVFEESIGDCEEILGDIHREIRGIADNLELSESERREKLEQLADNEIHKIHEQQALEDSEKELFGIRLPKIAVDTEISESESHWLTSGAIQRFVSEYLEKRIGKGEYILGEKELKTLRLSQGSRNQLLADFRKLVVQRTPMNREWDKWLKGSEPHCAITFESSCAADHREAHFIMPLHPLVLQAARFLESAEPVYTTLRITGSEVSPGDYLFAIYAWEYKGVRQELRLIPVCEDTNIRENFFDYIESGAEMLPDMVLDEEKAFEELDRTHHRLWSKEREEHHRKAQEISSFKRVSLKTSHRGRQSVVSEQLSNATNEKIRRMKQAQLNNNQADFERRMSELDIAEKGSDIHARAVVFGVLRMEG